jgi:hypothetical protein
MGFGTGLAAGLASGFEKVVERNQDSIRDSMSRAEKYMYERYGQEQASEREKIEKAEEAVKRLAKYVDVKNLPEGVRAEDVASAWFVKSGGSISEAEKMADRLSDAESYMGADAAKLTFAKARNTGMTVREMVKSTIRPPDLDYIRGPQKTMKGLFGEVDITAEALKRAGVPTDVQTRTAFDTEGFEGLGTKGKFYDVTEYQTKQKKDKLALEAATLANEKTKKEMGEIDVFDDNQIQEYFDRSNKNAASITGNVNTVTGDPEFKDTETRYSEGRTIYEKSLQNLTKEMLRTNSFGVKTNDSTFRGVAQQVLPFYPAGLAPNGNPGEMDIGKVYTVPKEDGSGPRTILWLGSEDNIFEIN